MTMFTQVILYCRWIESCLGMNLYGTVAVIIINDSLQWTRYICMLLDCDMTLWCQRYSTVYLPNIILVPNRFHYSGTKHFPLFSHKSLSLFFDALFLCWHKHNRSILDCHHIYVALSMPFYQPTLTFFLFNLFSLIFRFFIICFSYFLLD